MRRGQHGKVISGGLLLAIGLRTCLMSRRPRFNSRCSQFPCPVVSWRNRSGNDSLGGSSQVAAAACRQTEVQARNRFPIFVETRTPEIERGTPVEWACCA